MISHCTQRFSYYFSLSLRFTAQAFSAWDHISAALLIKSMGKAQSKAARERRQGKSGWQGFLPGPALLLFGKVFQG